MKRLFRGLFIATGAVGLAVGVLAVIEIVLSDPKRQQDDYPIGREGLPPETGEKRKERNFSIKRTKSELGFVYWILEGFGRYKCYILCDSWEEAVEQAKVKLAQVDSGRIAV